MTLRPLELIVKFRPGTTVTQKFNHLVNVIGEDFLDAHPLFPSQKDEQLAALFVVHLSDTGGLQQILTNLNNTDIIEFAHVPQDRSSF
jgi:hypothetical protein